MSGRRGGPRRPPRRDPLLGRVVELEVGGLAHGGDAVGHLPDGRACFVAYAVPGERVRARVTDARRRWARATTVEVLEASPDRVVPPCPLFGPDRCGGCTLQHIAPARQATLLADVIADQLRRIGHLEPPGGTVEVLRPHAPDGLGYRSRARFAVTPDGRLAFRRARSHDLQPVGHCPLLTPAADDALRAVATGWAGVEEVTLQAGTDGDVTLAVRANDTDPRVPGTFATVGGTGTPRGDGPAVAHHEVAGRMHRTGATSFFQASVAAAEVLVDLVRRAAEVAPGARVVDCYAGVGLFSAALAADGAHVTAIEAHGPACADARANTAGLPVEVVQADVADARVEAPVDVVVLDPPRTGAGAPVLTRLAGLDPARIVSVSCDPATFARDARVLVDAGYELTAVTGVDQFTHTGHVELVGTFTRAPQ